MRQNRGIPFSLLLFFPSFHLSFLFFKNYYFIYDPAIILLGIYPEKTIIPKDTHTPMFIAAVFIIARTWKQRKYPARINKMWHIYIMEYYSAIRRNEMVPFAETWMDLATVIQNEDRKRNTSIK